MIRQLNIHPDAIKDPTWLSRFDAESTGIEDLASSIRELGLLQPLVVREVKDGYQLIAGKRRLLAVKMLDWDAVPCRVFTATPKLAGAMQVVENLQRASLNPVEEAVSLQELKNATEWSDAEIGLKIGKRREYVARMRALLDLDNDTLDELVAGQLSPSHAYELRRIQDLDRRAYWRHWTVQYGATVKQLQDWIRDDLRQPMPQEELEEGLLPVGEPTVAEPHVLSCAICGATQQQALLTSMWVCQADYQIITAALVQQENNQ